jgi:hypothetical protein
MFAFAALFAIAIVFKIFTIYKQWLYYKKYNLKYIFYIKMTIFHQNNFGDLKR